MPEVLSNSSSIFGHKKKAIGRKLSNDERKNYRDEQRLLQGSQPTRDRRAIPIQPGSFAKKHETFKPTNTIGIKPGTRLNQPSSASSHSFARPKPSGLDRSTVIPDSDDEGTPPKKRLKRQDPEIIDLEENEQPLTVPQSPNTKILFERSPPRTPVREKKSTPPIISRYGRIAGADRKSPAPFTPKRKPWTGRRIDVIPESEDETPEKQPKQEQRRATVGYSKDKLTTPNRPRDQTIPKVVVEVPDPATLVDYPKEVENIVNHSSTQGGDRRICDLRESPDELQGNKTIPDVWKEHKNLKREVSPSNIRHTRFTSTADRKLPQPPAEKKTKRKSTPVTFDLSMFRYGDFSAEPLSRLAYDTTETSKFFVTSAGNDVCSSKGRSFDLLRAIKMDYGEPNCSKIRLTFPRSHNPGPEFADIEFSSDQEKERFLDFILTKTPSLKPYSKKRKWMERIFQLKDITAIDEPKPQKSRTSNAASEANLPKVQPKRMKLSDNLTNGDQPASNRSIEKLSHAHPSPSRAEPATSIPIKVNRIPPLTRYTRSLSRKQNVEIDSENEDDNDTSTSVSDVPGKRWQNPLVYPAAGKKKAEVEEHDLDRLRPHEFLNDNLIGLYIRFLEHHLERQHPDFAKRVYFFNSYFFATLTNTSKGQKGINYQGVEKWTRSFDIFAFDYLVVPINEDAHWYVAIICNLPTLLLPKAGNRSGSEDVEKAEIPKTLGAAAAADSLNAPSKVGELDAGQSPPDATKEGHVRESFTSLNLNDDSAEPNFSGGDKEAEPPEADEWPDEDENRMLHLTYQRRAKLLLEKALEPVKEALKSSKVTEPAVVSKTSKVARKRGKKGRNPGIRYNENQPAIIIFDSLDCPRRPTIEILREYLEEEAKAKRSLTIDSKEVVGMNAKQIPHQPNFSDCGLYLLAYLEKFVRNPDLFVRSVLRREMNRNKDWPAMKPGLFRSRLRKFLFELYEEQQALKDGKLEKSQPLMADAKSLNILLDNTLVEDNVTTDDDGKEPGVAKASPTPSTAKHAISDHPVTPTRTSPRSIGRMKGAPMSSPLKTPKTSVATTVPLSSDSMLLSLSDTTAKQDKLDETEKHSDETIQVPMTPPPINPITVDASPTHM
ncbi:Ulp1 protease [Nannizzia gypsea CBS 118893]|uniref:Ulp1 protease n=1 Tax=Arthroderma gypseum (strain ATCC MYA-4604 / CBS 118893) TaxID=535722 RepID=E4URT6_ARTGP|nr:Ulp1 protease [Nannizzia gypsea CBS 118893]EFR01208.1 Ulp1 protease [Nannizzia gypsea CBS 118893]